MDQEAKTEIEEETLPTPPESEIADEEAAACGTDAFFRTLDSLTPDDIPLPEAEKKKEKKGFDFFPILRGVLIAACAAVLIGCGVYLIRRAFDYLDSDKTYQEASSQFWDGLSDSAVKMCTPDANPGVLPDYKTSLSLTDWSNYTDIRPKKQNEQLAHMRAKLGALKQVNPDIFGYIFIKDTQIDYPVVLHDDNSYYLKHDYTGKYSGAGAIFADYNNSFTLLDNKNTVLYGHHMSSGSTMFHTLDNFFDEEFFKAHPDIYVYTFDGIYRFEVFAVYITRDTYPYIRTRFADGPAFVAFCEEMRGNSLYVRDGVTFTEDSRLLTLSTCTNIDPHDRITVQSVLVEVQD